MRMFVIFVTLQLIFVRHLYCAQQASSQASPVAEEAGDAAPEAGIFQRACCKYTCIHSSQACEP